MNETKPNELELHVAQMKFYWTCPVCHERNCELIEHGLDGNKVVLNCLCQPWPVSTLVLTASLTPAAQAA